MVIFTWLFHCKLVKSKYVKQFHYRCFHQRAIKLLQVLMQTHNQELQILTVLCFPYEATRGRADNCKTTGASACSLARALASMGRKGREHLESGGPPNRASYHRNGGSPTRQHGVDLAARSAACARTEGGRGGAVYNRSGASAIEDEAQHGAARVLHLRSSSRVKFGHQPSRRRREPMPLSPTQQLLSSPTQGGER